MAKLPKQSVTTFTTDKIKKLGSVKYRGMNLGEEITLTEAMALGDINTLIDTTVQILDACTFHDIDVPNLEEWAVDMLYIEVFRATKGDVFPIRFTCHAPVIRENDPVRDENGVVIPGQTQRYSGPCEHSFVLNIPVDRTELKFPEKYRETEIVMVSENGGFKLRQPSISDFKKIRQDDIKVFTVDTVISSIESFFDGDDVTSSDEFTKEELTEYVKAFSPEVAKKVEQFLENSPHLYLSLPITCPQCGTKSENEFRSLEDFFG